MRHPNDWHSIFGNFLEIETAKSNVTQCCRCSKSIPKNDVRLVRALPDGIYTRRRYWCRDCGLRQLEDEYDIIDQKISELRGQNV